MNPETHISLIAAAASAAGPQSGYTRTETRLRNGEEVEVEVIDVGAWKAKVTEIALDLIGLTDERSDLSKALATIEGAADKSSKQYKAFTGVVLRAEPERSSKRGVITLDTGTTLTDLKDSINGGNLPAGQEQIRTERTDNPSGRAMANKMRSLIGRKVLVYVEIETIKNSTKTARVLRHVIDQGPAAEFTSAA